MAESDFVIENGVLTKYNGPGGDVVIPDGVKEIGSYAFSGCTELTSVIIPDGVTSIGNYAFRDCSSLTSVTIPEGVTSIGYGAFMICSSLTSVTIPESVEWIGKSAFSYCSSLTSVTIYGSVAAIQGGVFGLCTSLTNVIIHDGVKRIDSYAFEACTSLTSIIIPSSVTKLGPYTFSGCANLAEMYIKQYREQSNFKGDEPFGAPYQTKVYWLDDAFTVTFLDDDGTVIKTEKVSPGEAATPPDIPEHNDRVFQGWDTPYDNIQSDITIRAVYRIWFTVVFLDDNDTVIKTERVLQGGFATPPAAIPIRSGYKFIGWSESFDDVQCDMTIHAVYTKIMASAITVIFREGSYSANACCNVWQWDYGRKIVIQGVKLPDIYDVHFCNVGDAHSKLQCGDEGGVYIPDEYLRTGKPINAFFYIKEGNGGKTTYSVHIHVIPRPKPYNTINQNEGRN